MKKIYYLFFALLVAAFNEDLAARGRGEITLAFADPLSDNMVIQQNKAFRVWGSAPSGQQVSIMADWLKSPVRVKANDAGEFIGIIDVPVAKRGDFTPHKISIESGNNTAVLENVLIGDVWLCSGQSNMQFKMEEAINGKQEIARADFPGIRLFNTALNFSSNQSIR